MSNPDKRWWQDKFNGKVKDLKALDIKYWHENEGESDVVDFGYKIQRGNELYTVVDFGNLCKFIAEVEEETVRRCVAKVESMRSKHEIETDPSGAFSKCLICGEEGATKGEFCAIEWNQIIGTVSFLLTNKK